VTTKHSLTFFLILFSLFACAVHRQEITEITTPSVVTFEPAQTIIKANFLQLGTPIPIKEVTNMAEINDQVIQNVRVTTKLTQDPDRNYHIQADWIYEPAPHSDVVAIGWQAYLMHGEHCLVDAKVADLTNPKLLTEYIEDGEREDDVEQICTLTLRSTALTAGKLHCFYLVAMLVSSGQPSKARTDHGLAAAINYGRIMVDLRKPPRGP
jgi:hypothetical protein